MLQINKQDAACAVYQHSSLSVKNSKHEMADMESVQVNVIVKPTCHAFLNQEGDRGIVGPCTGSTAAPAGIFCPLCKLAIYIYDVCT